MAKEIERKYLVRYLPDLTGITPKRIEQGYLPKAPGGPTTRVRLQDDEAFLTLKGGASGISRDEYEYPIPVADAKELLAQYCPERIVKLRYCIPVGEHILELDLFGGPLQGLILVEVELPSEDTPFAPLPWFGEDVSTNLDYANARLVKNGIPG